MSEANLCPDGPLNGIRVLDMSRLVAGNMLSLQLADFGAAVVKVESPGRGDPLRNWKERGLSLHWKVYGRNKKSITLNLKAQRAIEVFKKLVVENDVLIENFRPGTLERMGLGPDVLREINPALVIVRITGWGQTGPYANKPGFGTLIEAISGFAIKNGFADREPVLPPLAMADMIAGLQGAFAVLAALRYRDQTGSGQIIDLSLLEPMISILGPQAALYQVTGAKQERYGSRSKTASPRNVFRTLDDGWIAISASTEGMAARLYSALGVSEMLQDPRFASNAARAQNMDEAEVPVRDFIASRTMVEALRFFEDHEITAAPVYSVDQLVQDPHVRERGVFTDFPDKDLGHVAMHAVTPRFSASPGGIRTAAPELSAHTEEILHSIGYEQKIIQALKETGAI